MELINQLFELNDGSKDENQVQLTEVSDGVITEWRPRLFLSGSTIWKIIFTSFFFTEH